MLHIPSTAANRDRRFDRNTLLTSAVQGRECNCSSCWDSSAQTSLNIQLPGALRPLHLHIRPVCPASRPRSQTQHASHQREDELDMNSQDPSPKGPPDVKDGWQRHTFKNKGSSWNDVIGRWQPTSQLTFYLTYSLLSRLYPPLPQAVPSSAWIGQ
jgi:hypothetical protein